MSRAIAFVRCPSPFARWYWRISFQADSTASEPPQVKKTLASGPTTGAASPARRSASSIAGCVAVPQLVLKASVRSCSPATSANSSP